MTIEMEEHQKQGIEHIEPECGTCIVADFSPDHSKVMKVRLSNGAFSVTIGEDAVDSLRRLFEHERTP